MDKPHLCGGGDAMTNCTICAAPCLGTDDDDAPTCATSYRENLAGAELRPRPPRLRDMPHLVRVWGLAQDGDGREATPDVLMP